MPLAKGLRTPSQVHRDVEDLASDYPHKFSLRMAQLAVVLSESGILFIVHEGCSFRR